MNLKNHSQLMRFESSSDSPSAGQRSPLPNEQGRKEEVKASEVLRCPICGFENLTEAEVCAKCGQRLKPARVASPRMQTGAEGETDFGFPQARPTESAPRLPWDLPPSESEVPGEPWAEAEEPKVASERANPAEAIDSLGESTSGQGAVPPGAQPFEIRYYFGPAFLPPPILIPSSFFARASAFLIDFAIVVLMGSVLAYLVGVQSVLAEYQQKALEVGILNTSALQEKYPELASVAVRFFFYFFAAIVGYFGIFSAVGGQTVGKALLKIKVLKHDGRELGLFLGLARAFVLWTIIELSLGLYFPIAFLHLLFSRDGRAPHDYLFGSGVYRTQQTAFK